MNSLVHSFCSKLLLSSTIDRTPGVYILAKVFHTKDIRKKVSIMSQGKYSTFSNVYSAASCFIFQDVNQDLYPAPITIRINYSESAKFLGCSNIRII